MPAVSGLEKEFPDRVIARNLDATLAATRPIIENLGFENHGLVIRSSAGDVLWQQADHTVKMDEVRAAVKELLDS